MASLWARYLSLLETRPIVTKAVTSAALYVVGDTLAQKLDGTLDRSGYDVARGRTAVIWGGLIFAPIAHGWYNRVLNPMFPGTSAKSILAKTALDQTLWALPANAAYIGCSNLLMGRSVDEAKEVVQTQIKPVMLTNWSVWPAIQLANFRFIPPPLQLPVINVAIVGWSCFLAIKANEGNTKQKAKPVAQTDRELNTGKQ